MHIMAFYRALNYALLYRYSLVLIWFDLLLAEFSDAGTEDVVVSCKNRSYSDVHQVTCLGWVFTTFLGTKASAAKYRYRFCVKTWRIAVKYFLISLILFIWFSRNYICWRWGCHGKGNIVLKYESLIRLSFVLLWNWYGLIVSYSIVVYEIIHVGEPIQNKCFGTIFTRGWKWTFVEIDLF